eukprot:jgi/Tetstr1/464196/TSEL_009001.t1
MGVYCFKWKRGPWLKVGHYHRSNPWSRFAHRGWTSVICPDPALEFSSPPDFELLYWSPALSRRCERLVHDAFPDRFGEWIGAHEEAAVLGELTRLDPRNAASGCSMRAAMATRRLL